MSRAIIIQLLYLSITGVLTDPVDSLKSSRDSIVTGDTSQSNISSDPNIKIAPDYPNPFWTSFGVSFTLSDSDSVTIRIYDINGKEVVEPIRDFYWPGAHTIRPSTKDLPSGIYIYRVITSTDTLTQRTTLLK